MSENLKILKPQKQQFYHCKIQLVKVEFIHNKCLINYVKLVKNKVYMFMLMEQEYFMHLFKQK